MDTRGQRLSLILSALLLALAPLSAQVPESIALVQQRAHRSTRVGERVEGLTGVVTSVGLVRLDGEALVSLQSAPGTEDDDPATSEGLFLRVPESALPDLRVGQLLRVSGEVQQLRPGGQLSNLSITAIVCASAPERLAEEHDLPTPVILGEGGRPVPTAAIDDDTLGSVERPETSGTIFDPDQDALDFFESLEGMRVSVPGPVVVGPTSRYGELFVLADGGVRSDSFHGGAWLVVGLGDFNPERLLIKGTRDFPVPDVPAGTRFSGPFTGIMAYDYGHFRVVLSAPAPAHVLPPSGGLGAPLPPRAEGQVRVATYNVENLSARTEPQRLQSLGRHFAVDLDAPDLVFLQEIQDDSGPEDDGTVSGRLTLSRLCEAIESAGGPGYSAHEIEPANGREGGQPGGNIRVAFLVRDDSPLEVVQRPGGGTDVAVVVERGPDGAPRLSHSPGRVDPSAFPGSRVPLALELRWADRTLFAVNAHLASKGGDSPLFGPEQPPVLASETERRLQARALGRFVDQVLAVDPGALVLVAGDLNDFAFSAPVAELRGEGRLVDLTSGLPPAERWTYIYQGNAQALDHMLVSPGLLAAAGGRGALDYRVLHLNAPFPDGASDHDPCLLSLRLLPDVAELR